MAACAVAVTAEELIRQATKAAKAGDLARAAGLLAEACLIDPTDSTTWLFRASLAQSDTERRGYMESALRVDPSNPTAREWLDRMIAAPPAAAPALNNCPFCSYQTETVADCCVKCRGVMSFRLDLLKQAPQVHREQMRFAAEHYDGFDRSNPEVPLRIALCHMNLGDWQSALEELRGAVALGVDHREVFEAYTRLERRAFVLVVGKPGERRDRMVEMLNRNGCRATGVERRSEALRAIERETPSSVVIDDTDGYTYGFQLARELRAAKATAKTPVVLATKGGVLAAIRGKQSGVSVLLPGSPEPEAVIDAAVGRMSMAQEALV